jgi:hypothetical protein
LFSSECEYGILQQEMKISEIFSFIYLLSATFSYIIDSNAPLSKRNSFPAH